MLKLLKTLLKLAIPNKYKRKGTCNRCGCCCKEIIFTVEGRYLFSEKLFERLKTFKPYYRNFTPTGRAENGALTFTCNYLNADNTCGAYFYRSLGCRLYPHLTDKNLQRGLHPFEECGYQFLPKYTFSHVLAELEKYT